MAVKKKRSHLFFFCLQFCKEKPKLLYITFFLRVILHDTGHTDNQQDKDREHIPDLNCRAANQSGQDKVDDQCEGNRCQESNSGCKKLPVF